MGGWVVGGGGGVGVGVGWGLRGLRLGAFAMPRHTEQTCHGDLDGGGFCAMASAQASLSDISGIFMATISEACHGDLDGGGVLCHGIGTSFSLGYIRHFHGHILRSISGLVVEYIVAIDVSQVRFPADAF